jgi:phenylalanyl-tRNA synthetase beta chain
MKFTFNWLQEYLDTNLSVDEICEILTSIGLEVESVIDQAASLKNFQIAQITNFKKHPDADRLNICEVEADGQKLQIVCGAPNVRKGLKTILAPIGGIVPANGMEVKKAKIRGVESSGMLCSKAELGLGQDSEGIIDLPENTNMQSDIAKILGLDAIIEIAITPNRGDCLGVYGIARDLAAAGAGKLKPLAAPKIKDRFDNPVKSTVTIANCKFTTRYIKNLQNKPSPEWLKVRLAAIGIESRNAIIDVTNYIAYNFGQPIHAYDADEIAGDIEVRHAKEGEKFKSLLDENYTLGKEMIVVSDKEKILSLAGIIGGKDSAINDKSQNILVEAAFFASENITLTGRKINIESDARYRFERNVDVAFVEQALDYAASLIHEICGGELSKKTIADKSTAQIREIKFDFAQIAKITGVDVPQKKVEEILKKLGCSIESGKVRVPSWRSDLTIEVDLIEEVLRLYGLDKIIPQSFASEQLNTLPSHHAAHKNLRKNMAACGLDEVISWSFISSKKAKLFALNSIGLLNPISEDLDVMRASLLPNLVDKAIKNDDRNFTKTTIFELGSIFHGTKPEDQISSLAGIRCGVSCEKSVNNDSRDFDVFDVKDDSIKAIALSGVDVKKLSFSKEGFPDYFHPTRSATIKFGKNIIGYFGEIHPQILKNLGFDQRINAFEIFPDNIPMIKTTQPFILNDLQAVSRDFAFILSDEIEAANISDNIYRSAKGLIEDVRIFDVYKGQGIKSGEKSIALNVKIQPQEKTLTSEEIDALSNKIIQNIESKFNAKLRS